MFIFHSRPNRATKADEFVQTKVKDVDRRARELESEVERLRGQLDRHQEFTEALWFLVRERLGLSEDDPLIAEINRRLERYEEYVAAAAKACEQCGRTVSLRSGQCVYCGSKDD